MQLYGSADAFFKYGKVMGDSTAGIDDGGIGNSFFGLRGEEELGAGLKAVFVLEEGFSIDSGKSCCMSEEDSSSNSGSETFTQQAYVGLKGAFGQIALGRQYAPRVFHRPLRRPARHDAQPAELALAARQPHDHPPTPRRAGTTP